MTQKTPLTEFETKTALENTTSTFRYVEEPLLQYISQLLDISPHEIYPDKDAPEHPVAHINLNDVIYSLELQVVNQQTAMVTPWDKTDPSIAVSSKKILEYIGYVVYIIKTVAYSTIRKNAKTDIQVQLSGTHVEFNHDTSNLQIVFDIDNQPYKPKRKLALGFVFNRKN